MIAAAWMAVQLIGVLIVAIAAVTGVLWWVNRSRDE